VSGLIPNELDVALWGNEGEIDRHRRNEAESRGSRHDPRNLQRRNPGHRTTRVNPSESALGPSMALTSNSRRPR